MAIVWHFSKTYTHSLMQISRLFLYNSRQRDNDTFCKAVYALYVHFVTVVLLVYNIYIYQYQTKCCNM